MLIYLPYLSAYNVPGAMPDIRVNETDAILDFMESISQNSENLNLGLPLDSCYLDTMDGALCLDPRFVEE